MGRVVAVDVVEIIAVEELVELVTVEILAVGTDVGMSTTKKSNMPTDPMVATTKKSNITAADETVVGITNKITIPTTGGVVRTFTGMRRDVDPRVVTRTADMERRVEDTPTVTATTMAVITIKDGNKREGIPRRRFFRLLRYIYFERRKKKDRI